MLTGMLLGVVFYRPIFRTFMKDANAKEWMKDEANVKNQGINKIVKTDTLIVAKGMKKIITHNEDTWLYKGSLFIEKRSDTVIIDEGTFAGYPRKYISLQDSKPTYFNFILATNIKWKFIFLVWLMIVFVTMVYGPVAAFLVELFPTKIRYTSMSLPYHIGNGVFGGLVPFIATLLSTTFTSDPLVGLWYPIGVAALCFVIGTLYLSNKVDKNIND